MKLGYTIIYVPDVAASLSFFKSVFGLSRRFLHESGDCGELAADRLSSVVGHNKIGIFI